MTLTHSSLVSLSIVPRMRLQVVASGRVFFMGVVLAVIWVVIVTRNEY